MPPMPHLSRCTVPLLVALAAPAPASANGDLFGDDVTSLLRTSLLAVEVSTGYISGRARETVYYDTAAERKLSQLNWDIRHAFIVGGRVVVQPTSRIAVRARGWVSVDDQSKMKDFDWLAGYFGDSSWTHRSIHPDTELTRAYQADISIAGLIWGTGDASISALAGYRHTSMKWRSKGGSYLYSTNAWRDTPGTFPAGQPVIDYEQTWRTPYLGLATTFDAGDNLSFNFEVIGSLWAQGRDRDYHVLRDTLFLGNSFDRSSMVGLSAGMEYHFTPNFALSLRGEYQAYFEALGGTTMIDQATGLVSTFPKPASGAENETYSVSIGLRARL